MSEQLIHTDSQEPTYITLRPIDLDSDYPFYAQNRREAGKYDPEVDSVDAMQRRLSSKGQLLVADYITADEEHPCIGHMEALEANQLWPLMGSLLVGEKYRSKEIGVSIGKLLVKDMIRRQTLRGSKKQEILVDVAGDPNDYPELYPHLARSLYEDIGFKPTFIAVGMEIKSPHPRSPLETPRPFIDSEEYSIDQRRKAAFRHVREVLASDHHEFTDSWNMDVSDLNTCLRESPDSRLAATTIAHWVTDNNYQPTPRYDVAMYVGKPYAVMKVLGDNDKARKHTSQWGFFNQLTDFRLKGKVKEPLVELLHLAIAEQQDGHTCPRLGGYYIASDVSSGELIPFHVNIPEERTSRPRFRQLNKTEAKFVFNELVRGAKDIGNPKPRPYIDDPVSYKIVNGIPSLAFRPVLLKSRE